MSGAPAPAAQKANHRAFKERTHNNLIAYRARQQYQEEDYVPPRDLSKLKKNEYRMSN